MNLSAMAWRRPNRRRLMRASAALAATGGLSTVVRARAAAPPVRLGMTAEFSLGNSTSAQSIERGVRIAIAEINARGGVLGGRPLELAIRDDRSVPARGIDNLRELAAMPDLVAVFGGRFSPVVIEMVPVAHELGILLFSPWAAANGIIEHKYRPSFTFRLSLTDALAINAMLDHAWRRGLSRIGLLIPNTAWGRSSQEAAATAVARRDRPQLQLVRVRSYNWGDTSLVETYKELRDAGAQAVVLVANDREGIILTREIAALPETMRLPILCHWGITGGRFFETVGRELARLDLVVVQTFSFMRADPAARERFMARAAAHYGLKRIEDIEAPVGIAHAYDLTHILALAIDAAGSTARAAIRDALETIGPYRGLVGTFPRPFTPERHDALGIDSVFMARYREDGLLVPLAD